MLIAACAYSAVAKEKTKPMPSAEFLTFLADLQKVEGKWVSPLDVQLTATEPPKPKQSTSAKKPVIDKPKVALKEPKS